MMALEYILEERSSCTLFMKAATGIARKTTFLGCELRGLDGLGQLLNTPKLSYSWDGIIEKEDMTQAIE
jgi:hypothetical protein